MDIEKLEKLRQTAMTTLRILNSINKGHRSSTLIAKKVGSTKQLVDYYLKAVEAK